MEKEQRKVFGADIFWVLTIGLLIFAGVLLFFTSGGEEDSVPIEQSAAGEASAETI